MALAIGLVAVVAGGVPAGAQELDGDAIRALAARGVWQADFAEYGFWNWSEDGSVCLRLTSAEGDCADTGTWHVDGNVLCYELTWWGETVGEREGCFTVRAEDDGRFETLFHGGAMVSTMFGFSVID